MSIRPAIIRPPHSICGQRGQGLAEYALILTLVAIVSIAALMFLGGHISGILQIIGQSV